MKICKRCSKEFSYTIVVDGKVRNVGSRKYCLECSPWGTHNTRKLDGEPDARIKQKVEVVCRVCNRKFLATSHRTQCNVCGVVIKRMRNKMLAVSYLGGECKECGFKGDPSSFTFHHRDSSLKEFGVSSELNRMSWERIRKELDKCDLLCLACHGKKHSRYDDEHLMSFVMGDDAYWEKYPWFDKSVFNYLKE